MACVSPDKSITTPKSHIDGVPDFGWRVPLSYKCQEKCGPFQSPRLKQLYGFIGLSVRCAHLMIFTLVTDLLEI